MEATSVFIEATTFVLSGSSGFAYRFFTETRGQAPEINRAARDNPAVAATNRNSARGYLNRHGAQLNCDIRGRRNGGDCNCVAAI